MRKCVENTNFTNKPKIAPIRARVRMVDVRACAIFDIWIARANFVITGLCYLRANSTLYFTFNNRGLYAEHSFNIICTLKMGVRVLGDGRLNACKHCT